MRILQTICFILLAQFVSAQTQGVNNTQTKLRVNQLRWTPTDATNDSIYIIRGHTTTGEPAWYKVKIGGAVIDTTLAGDVVGGLNSTFVRKINGVTVENKTPQNREVLQYDGTKWTPDSIDLADLPTLAQSVLLGRTSASTGTPQSITLGTGLAMSGTVLSNSAPDQTVTISGATGTYPNFTVTPTSPAGSSGQVQYNNAGAFGALDSVTVSANPDRVGIGVPTPTARLDIQGSGSTSATNAFRVRNSAGTEIMALGNDSQVKITATTAASKPSLILNGTGFSGGTSTTTKPTLLIEPTGTTSTGWSTSGTKLGVNAESGFTGNLLDLQLNGVNTVRFNGTSSYLRTSDAAGVTFGYGNSGFAHVGNSTYFNWGANYGLWGRSTGWTMASSLSSTDPSSHKAVLSLEATNRGFLPPRLTTAQRDAVTWVAGDVGMMIFCTDCTATDASTGVSQTWNGTTWKNHY